MKFNTISSLVLLAASSLAALPNCGHQCDRNKSASTALSAPLKLIAVRDKFDANIQYEVQGTVVIDNDCEFHVENFYLNPQPRGGAKWHCQGPNNAGITLSSEIVNAISPATPVEKLSYDVEATPADLFCHVGLIQDCTEISLIDESGEYQLIAVAKLDNKEVTTEPVSGSTGSTGTTGTTGGSTAGSTGSTGTTGTTGGSTTGSNGGSNGGSISSGSSTSTTSNTSGKTSDATTYKWSMALIGLTSLAALFLA